MSVVTNLMVTFSSSEKVDDIITQLENFVYRGNRFSIKSVKDKSLPLNWYGGSKVLECNILIGAYNHFPLDEFIVFLKQSVQWDDIETVQLIVKLQDDDRFKIINLDEG